MGKKRANQNKKPILKSHRAERLSQGIRAPKLTDEQRAIEDYFRFHPLARRGR